MEKEMTKERIEELINECIGYICEVVNDEKEARNVFNHLGFTEEEQEYFDIPQEVELPTRVTVNINDLDYDPECDIEDTISDYLSDTYGYCHYGFDFETDATTGEITIFDIEWDTSDS